MKTIADICEEFKVARQGVTMHIKKGHIQAIKFGRLWRITDEEFERIKTQGVITGDKRRNKSNRRR
jgi:excisionase family DNA binding protein